MNVSDPGNRGDAALSAEGALLSAHAALWRGRRVVSLGAPRDEASRLGFAQHEPSSDEVYDVAVVYLPKAKRRQDLLLALAASRSTRLLVVGHKRVGIKSARKRLRELGEVLSVEHGGHCQLIALELSERRAAPNLDDWEQRFDVGHLGLVTLPGVFCDGRLDDASALLLEHIRWPDSGRVLDLGCGSGVLGLSAKRSRPALEVMLADVDPLAVESARRGARLNALKTRCVESDVYSAIDGRFDLVVTNPPFHQGVSTDYDVTRRIIAEAPAHLTPGGELWLVANHFLPWREPLEASFSSVELVHADGRFKVWRARRP